MFTASTGCSHLVPFSFPPFLVFCLKVARKLILEVRACVIYPHGAQREQIAAAQRAIEQRLATLGLKSHEAGGQKNCQIFSVVDALQQQGVNIQAQLSLHRREIKKWLINNYLLLRGQSSLDSTDYIELYCDDAKNITPASWKEK